MIEKSAQSVSIIGGADGPTSVFIAGKTGKKRHIPLKERIRRAIYKCKRKKVEKTIVANPHTLEQVIRYLQDTYGAVELSKESHSYLEQRKCLKESLILQHKPELLGELAEIKRPATHDEESVRAFIEQVQARSQRAESIPDEMLPMDFHVYTIELPNVGQIEFGIDTKWEIFGDSYSGSKKGMKQLQRISQDAYLYYGVTEEDIRDKTKRYSVLVTVLST